MLENLIKMKKKIGLKECQKAIENNKVQKAFVARDADEKITKGFIELCSNQQVKIEFVDTMKDLGKACGIDVGASTVVILKD